MNERPIATGLAIGGQISPEEIEELKAKGYRTIINVRTPDDEGYLAEEERLVEDAGLNYAAIPVSPALIDDSAVMRFSQALESVGGKPAYAHCGSGGRAGLMALLHLAIENRWSVERALEEGERMGIAPSETSPYRAFFEEFIRRHSAGERL